MPMFGSVLNRNTGITPQLQLAQYCSGCKCTWNFKGWSTDVNNEETQNLRFFHEFFKKLWDKQKQKTFLLFF